MRPRSSRVLYASTTFHAADLRGLACRFAEGVYCNVSVVAPGMIPITRPIPTSRSIVGSPENAAGIVAKGALVEATLARSVATPKFFEKVHTRP